MSGVERPAMYAKIHNQKQGWGPKHKNLGIPLTSDIYLKKI